MNIFKRMKNLFISPPPRICVEFAPERLAMVIMDGDSSNPLIKECRERPVEKGLLNASFLSRNIQDVKSLRNILDDLYGAEKGRHRRLGIVLPDSIVKISILSLESVPTDRRDLDSLIKWNIEKSIPFDLSEAQVSYSLQGITKNQNSQFIILTSRREVILEYERLCGSVGLKAGLIVPSSIAVLQLLCTSSSVKDSGDWLFVNSDDSSGSVAILRDKKIEYFKNVPFGRDNDLSSLVHQTTMYYEDRLKGEGFRRVFYLGRERDRERAELRKSLLFREADLSKIVDVTGNEGLQGVPFTMKALCAASTGMLCGLSA